MTKVFLSIGSNINPQKNILYALHRLREEVALLKVSNFYRSAALYRPNDPFFLNGMAVVQTFMTPRDLKYNVLRRIEEETGRERTADAYAPRSLDLDICVFGDLVIHEDGLIIPDPDIQNRSFLAVPLLELEPSLILPDIKRPISDIVCGMETGNLAVDEEFSLQVKERFCR